MKTFILLCCIFGVFSATYGLPYNFVREQAHQEKNLLNELVARMMDITSQKGNINAETHGLKIAAIEPVAKAADLEADQGWNCPPGIGANCIVSSLVKT